jgi:hypothetical protein
MSDMIQSAIQFVTTPAAAAATTYYARSLYGRET